MNESKKRWISPVGICVPIGITSTMIFEFFNFLSITFFLYPPIGALILLFFILGMQQLYKIHKNRQSIYRYLLLGMIGNFFICVLLVSCISFLRLDNGITSNSWIIDGCLLLAIMEGIYIGKKIFQPIKIDLLLKAICVTISVMIFLFFNGFGMFLNSILIQYKNYSDDSYFFNVVCLMGILIIDFIILGLFVTQWVNRLTAYYEKD